MLTGWSSNGHDRGHRRSPSASREASETATVVVEPGHRRDRPGVTQHRPGYGAGRRHDEHNRSGPRERCHHRRRPVLEPQLSRLPGGDHYNLGPGRHRRPMSQPDRAGLPWRDDHQHAGEAGPGGHAGCSCGPAAVHRLGRKRLQAGHTGERGRTVAALCATGQHWQVDRDKALVRPRVL